MQLFKQEVIDILRCGGIGIMPTDTIYGFVGRCDLESTVERIYRVRRRTPTKPCIILIASMTDLDAFDTTLTHTQKARIQSLALWPGKVSIVIPTSLTEKSYLTRGNDSLAFRIPDSPELLALLEKTGPLIAPSANFEGMPPATTISNARSLFDTKVDFYVDGGMIEGEPSTLIAFEDENLTVLRKGAVPLTFS